MEIKSEPRYLNVPVTILDFIFVGGMTETLTLREGDTYDDLGSYILVTIVDPKNPTKVLETITYYKSNALAFKVRETTLRVKDTRPIPTVSSTAQDVQPEG